MSQRRGTPPLLKEVTPANLHAERGSPDRLATMRVEGLPEAPKASSRQTLFQVPRRLAHSFEGHDVLRVPVEQLAPVVELFGFVEPARRARLSGPPRKRRAPRHSPRRRRLPRDGLSFGCRAASRISLKFTTFCVSQPLMSSLKVCLFLNLQMQPVR